MFSLEPSKPETVLEEEALKLGAARPPVDLAPELTAAVELIIESAFVDAFRVMMGLCGLLALTSAVVSAATISNEVIHHEERTVSRLESGLAGPH